MCINVRGRGWVAGRIKGSVLGFVGNSVKRQINVKEGKKHI